jgi:quercetin dioxygenase-like cupin family protein
MQDVPRRTGDSPAQEGHERMCVAHKCPETHEGPVARTCHPCSGALDLEMAAPLSLIALFGEAVARLTRSRLQEGYETMNTAKQIETNNQPFVVKRGEGETIKALGSEITFLGREPGAWSLTQVSSPRGAGSPQHEHDFGESYYVLAGSLSVTVAGREVVLGAGDFVHVPAGTVHGFKAIADAPTQFLVLQSPGDADEFFRACAREITKMPADLARVPEIGARYGIRVAPSSCNPPAR